jgi:dienelactone hydrolase
MNPHPRYPRWLLTLPALLLLGCSDSPAPASDSVLPDAGLLDTTADAQPPAPDGPAQPRIVFLDENGTQVTSQRYSDPFVVRMEGMPPGAEVTLTAKLWGYRSQSVFVVDEHGTVDLGRDAPKSGSYSGVDPDGPVWSMVRESNDKGTSYDLEFSVASQGKTVASATLVRDPLDKHLKMTAVQEQGLIGAFYAPQSASAPLPAVLVVSGSEGGLDYAAFWAAYIASLGHPALGLAYFGLTGLPSALTEIPLEGFGTALDWLGKRPEVDAQRIGVAGVSRGGELALMLCARYPAVRAVFAEVPSGVRWGSAGEAGKAAWTWAGQDLAYLTSAGTGAQPAVETLSSGVTAYRMTPLFQAALTQSAPSALAEATIAVEQCQGPVVLIAGDDDGVWPSCALAKVAMDRLTDSGHVDAHGDVSRCYPDTGHMIGPPGWPTTESYAYANGSYVYVAGGTPAGTAHAQRQADRELRKLLQALDGT